MYAQRRERRRSKVVKTVFDNSRPEKLLPWNLINLIQTSRAKWKHVQFQIKIVSSDAFYSNLAIWKKNAVNISVSLAFFCVVCVVSLEKALKYLHYINISTQLKLGTYRLMLGLTLCRNPQVFYPIPLV